MFNAQVAGPVIDAEQDVTHDVPMHQAMQEMPDTNCGDIILRRSQRVRRPQSQMTILFICRNVSMTLVVLLTQSLIKKSLVVLNPHSG